MALCAADGDRRLSFAAELLEQAEHLLTRDPARPTGASLRRSISASCYAIFHHLSEACAARAAPAEPPALRPVVRRSLTHEGVKRASQLFAQAAAPSASVRPLVPPVVPAELVTVARNVMLLQDARHGADYALELPVSRASAEEALAWAQQAVAGWENIHETPEARAFLAAMLVQGRRGA